MLSIKNSILVFVIAFACCAFSSCKDDNDVATPVTTGAVYLLFKNVVNGQPLNMGNLAHTNAAGNVYSVDELKYYISNITFIKNDGTSFKAPNYELVNEAVTESKLVKITGVPNGTYSTMRFNMGVDSTVNFAGAPTGDLDPVLGMYWDWQAGYVYFKHVGSFIDSSGVQDVIDFHYGTLKALVTEEVPVNLTVASDQRNIAITFHLDKVYSAPNLMDFNGENVHQSTGPGENGWLQLIKQNFQDAFEVTGVY